MSLVVARRWAKFSVDRRFRYALGREFEAVQGDLLNGWDVVAGRDTVLFVMLNPSLASQRNDDPTLRRCMSLAHSWGFRRLAVVNLFGFVTPEPRELRLAQDPIGPRNDAIIRQRARSADSVIVAWGNHGVWKDRAGVLAMLRRARTPLFHLGLTQDGHPRHPLYLPADTQPIAFPLVHQRPLTRQLREARVQ